MITSPAYAEKDCWLLCGDKMSLFPPKESGKADPPFHSQRQSEERSRDWGLALELRFLSLSFSLSFSLPPFLPLPLPPSLPPSLPPPFLSISPSDSHRTLCPFLTPREMFLNWTGVRCQCILENCRGKDPTEKSCRLRLFPD